MATPDLQKEIEVLKGLLSDLKQTYADIDAKVDARLAGQASWLDKFLASKWSTAILLLVVVVGGVVVLTKVFG